MVIAFCVSNCIKGYKNPNGFILQNGFTFFAKNGFKFNDRFIFIVCRQKTNVQQIGIYLIKCAVMIV